MPPLYQNWERKMRHANARVIPSHCPEEVALSAAAIAQRYCPVLLDHVDFEVPYSFNAQSPSIVTFYGLGMALDLSNECWIIFRSERDMCVAVQLMYSVRSQKRFYRLSAALPRDISVVGFGALTATTEDAADLKALLDTMERIRWPRVPEMQRTLPQETGRYTPVLPNGDWVNWDLHVWVAEVIEDPL